MALKIYLAGPDVFLADAQRIGKLKKEMCGEFGFEGLFPLDKDEDIGGDAAKIFRANCALMRQADIGLFNLTPFRGPSSDPGTVFELGYLFARGKPAYGYTSDPALYRERVAAAFGPANDRHERPWDRNGYAIENFGLADNLMIVRAIEDSGGAVTAVAEQTEDAMTVLAASRAFRACLEVMREYSRSTHAVEARL
jgi:nucleoside 2-deoxyribosyltransferase